jgi:uncharacterized protein (DUF2235 family)
MPLNHVICCDGTGNEFGPNNTNVVRLSQVLDRRPEANQRLYYDPGIGTLPPLGVFTRVGKWLSEAVELAFGTDLTWKVEEAYSYLMDHWEPGDNVFLFGFSRGAYTVRVLAGMLHALGLLPRGNPNLVPYVVKLFKSVRGQGTAEQPHGNFNYWKLCNQFRWSFARAVPDNDQRHFRVHFLGLWDTVSSVGWVWDPAKFPYTVHNPSVRVIRHAVSIDERRWFFRQNLVRPDPEEPPLPGQDVDERWFAGVHADVGGGYPDDEENGGLWRVGFQWILDEAVKAGLRLDDDRLERVLHRTPPPARPWDERQHESLTPVWWLAEFFPKLHRPAGWRFKVPEIGLGRHRFITDGQSLDRSALLRIREKTDYAPPNLSQKFRDRVRQLAEVPDKLEYQANDDPRTQEK